MVNEYNMLDRSNPSPIQLHSLPYPMPHTGWRHPGSCPRIDAPVRAARGFLPFRLCGQPAPGPPIQGKGHETDRKMMAKGNQSRNVPAFVFKNE